MNSNAQSLLSEIPTQYLYLHAQHLMAHQQYGAAYDAYSSFIPLAEGYRKSQAEYDRSLCALYLNHPDGEARVLSVVRDHQGHLDTSKAYADLGNYFYEKKKYAKAASYYERVDIGLFSKAQRYEIEFKTGYAYFNNKVLDKALEHFNAIKLLSGKYQPAANYYAGFTEFLQGEYIMAIKDLKRAEATDSYKDIVPSMIVASFYKQQLYDELLDYVKAIGNRDVTNKEDIALLVAESQYKKGAYQLALDQYNQALNGNLSKSAPAVLYRAGQSAYHVKEFNEAVKFLKVAAIAQDSVKYFATYSLGNAYLQLGQKVRALSAFLVINQRKFQPVYEESLYLYGATSLDLGKMDQAISALEELMQTFPNSAHAPQVNDLLSNTYLNANNYNKAIDYIESIPKRSPSVNEAYQKATMLKGEELFNAALYEEAITYFERSLQHPIRKELIAEAAFWCGESYAAIKKPDDAIPLYKKVISQNNQYVRPAYYGLGYIHFNKKDYAQAKSYFMKFVDVKNTSYPSFTDGLLRLADCYYIEKNYPLALNNYQRAIDLKSADLDYACLQAAQILSMQSKYNDANIMFDRIIKGYPRSAFFEEALYHKAQMEFEQGHYPQSVELYSSVIERNPSSKFAPYAYLRRASSYYNLNNPSAAADDYIAIVEQYTTHPLCNDVITPLQEALTLSGRASQFETYLEKIKAAHPDAQGIERIEFEAARNSYFNQEYALATQALNRFIENYPESLYRPEALYYLAESNYRLDDFNQALRLYYQLLPDQSFSFRTRVLSRIASLEFDQNKFANAIVSYRELALTAENKKDQFTAWFGLMESYYQTNTYDSVLVYANKILDKGAMNAGVHNKSSLFIAKAWLGKGKTQDAIDALLFTLNTAHDESGAEAKYLLAKVQFDQALHKQCYETLLGLNNDFAAYPQWVGESFLLMAENFISMGEQFQAEATLKSLDNFPLDNIKSRAAVRLSELEKSKLNNQVNEIDSVRHD